MQTSRAVYPVLTGYHAHVWRRHDPLAVQACHLDRKNTGWLMTSTAAPHCSSTAPLSSYTARWCSSCSGVGWSLKRPRRSSAALPLAGVQP